MGRFFSGRKNQAETDFRRFEQEIYLNSSENRNGPPQDYPQNFDGQQDHPCSYLPIHSPNDQFSNPTRHNPSLSHSFYKRSHERMPPHLRYEQNPPPHSEEPYNPDPQKITYKDRQYQRNTYHPDELKGLGFCQDEEGNYFYNENSIERPSSFKFIIAIIGLISMITVIWFGYYWFSHSATNDPAHIQAELGPFKVKPENSGGTAIPYQDKLIYGRLSPNSEAPVERLLPPSEQPTPLLSSPPPVSTGPYLPQHNPPYPSQVQQTNPSMYQDPHSERSQGSNIDPNYSYPSQREPQYSHSTRGQTQGYHPSHNQNSQGQPLNPPQNPYSPSAQPYLPQNAPYPQRNYPDPKASSYSQAPVPSVEKKTMESLPLPSKTVPTAPMFYIQLGTLPTETSAKQEMNRLRKKYSSEFVDLNNFIKAFETNDGKKIYRIIGGPFHKRNSALAKCNKFGNTCRVVQIP